MCGLVISLCRVALSKDYKSTIPHPALHPFPLSPQETQTQPTKMAHTQTQAQTQTQIDEITHRTVTVNGIKMHVAEKGSGPVVLFIHGFPELWYSWRHQIVALAELGYRAVAPDMRGYGGTDAPPDASSYTYGHLVGDLVALIDELGVDQVFVVGHDWGAIVAWWLCLFRPDRVKALVNTSVAFSPRNPMIRPVDALRALYGDDYYICRFQVPGEIEDEFAKAGGADIVLRKIFPYRTPGPLLLPKGQWYKDLLPYPSWLSEEDVTYYRDTFSRTGFTGGLNYYRALNLNWEITAPWNGAQVKVPVKFIVGDLDLTYHIPRVQDYINKGGMKKDVPYLQDVVILEGVGHFLQEEVPEVINEHIVEFIKKF